MTNHPITPPLELMRQWYQESDRQLAPYYVYMAHSAAQWAADQELEACCEWLGVQETRSPQWFDLRHDACALVSDLRAARRPKLPSLKEQALAELAATERCHPADYSTIRKALEALPND